MSNLIPVTIFTNGGIVSPGDLRKISMSAHQAGADYLYVGNRQELRFYVHDSKLKDLADRLDTIDVHYLFGEGNEYNIVTSGVVKDILKTKIWLTEGYYRDVVESFEVQPLLPVNIVDPDQYAVPLFTGWVNYIASTEEDFWYVYLNIPQNKISDWLPVMVNSEHIPSLTDVIEKAVRRHTSLAVDLVMSEVYQKDHWNFKNVERLPKIPDYHYFSQEGFHPMGEKYWLGMFSKSNKFSINALDAFAVAALDTNIGSLYVTPWDSIMIKNISESNISIWEDVLGVHNINTGHAAIDLCWNCNEWDESAFALRQKISHLLSEQDARCEGMIIGVNTPANDSFYSITIKEEGLFTLFGKKYFSRFHIKYKESFNPNDPKVKPFMDHIPEKELPSFIHYLMESFYKNKKEKKSGNVPVQSVNKSSKISKYPIYQCNYCLTQYDPEYGDELNGIQKGVSFDQLPDNYCCSVCEAGKNEFSLLKKESTVVSNA